MSHFSSSAIRMMQAKPMLIPVVEKHGKCHQQRQPLPKPCNHGEGQLTAEVVNMLPQPEVSSDM
jgi:hypothetical protein